MRIKLNNHTGFNMRELSGSHGSRRNAPQAAHPGCPGCLAQVGRCRHPLPRYRPPPGYQCGRLRPKSPPGFVRTLSTMRPCAHATIPTMFPAKARCSLSYTSPNTKRDPVRMHSNRWHTPGSLFGDVYCHSSAMDSITFMSPCSRSCNLSSTVFLVFASFCFRTSVLPVM